MAAKTKGSKSPQKKNNKANKTTEALQTSPLSEKQWFYLSVACAVSSILLYWNTLSNDFVFDDTAAVVKNPDVRGESSFFQLLRNDFWATPLQDPLSHKSYRPITTLSYRITHALHGMNPMPFHFINIMLNAVACYMAVQCVKCMTTSTTTWIFPLMTCLLFTFHPIHTEVVATVVGRADLLAAIFSFASFLFHSHCMQTSLPISSICLGFAWFSALSKETGLTILGICGAHEVARIWLLLPSINNNNNMSRSVTRFTVLATTGLSYLVFRKCINGPTTGIMPSAGDNPLITSQGSTQYGLTAAFIMVVYMKCLVNPFALLCDYGYNVVPLVEGWNDFRNLFTLAMLIGVVLLSVLAIRNAQQQHDGRLLLALAWIFVPLLPASHVMILGTVVAERLLYLPSLGYGMLISLFVEYVWKKLPPRQQQQQQHLWMAVLVVVLALFTNRIITRNQEWSTEPSLWKADYTANPQNVKIAMSHASDLHKLGQDDDAYHIVKDLEGLGDVQMFELCTIQAKTTALSPQAGRDFAKAYAILDQCVEQVNARHASNPSQKDHLVFGAYGYLLSQEERYDEAAVWFHKASNAAERANVSTVGPVCNEGEILARMNKWKESVPVLRKCADLSIRARDQDETKLMNLAKAYYMSREFDEAEKVLLNEMSETLETLAFLETVREAKVKFEEWAKQKAAQEQKNESESEAEHS